MKSGKSLNISFIFLCIFLFFLTPAFSQITNDSTKLKNNTKTDSLASTTLKDTLRLSKQAIESKITYSSSDSIVFLTKEKKIKLYGNVKIEYEKIILTAAYIEIDFNTKLLFACWLPDSAGNPIGKPVFKEGEKNFEALTMKYNFETKQGYLTSVFTEESEAYLHGKELKKLENNTILIKNGSFTTCPDHDPHFEISFKRAKVIPNEKIITGPVWLTVENVPLPVALPFGFFPNTKGRQSGIIIPGYGERASRGFFLENGGYYFGINDYMDLSLLGDIYSRGSWAIKTSSNYKKRYKYDGNLSINYAVNKLGTPETSDYSVQKDFFIVWKHNQDKKANPRHYFNADVKAGSSNYNKFNPSSANDYLSSNFSSSVTYNSQIGKNFNLTSNIRHNQNKQSKMVSMSLPELSLSMNRVYPFRRKTTKGKLKWYENINLNYVMNARNTISKSDTTFYSSWAWKDFSNGVKHQIPISWSQKVLKYLNWTSSFNYTERWYLQTIAKNWDNDNQKLISDTIQGFKANRDFDVSSQFTTKLYGLYQISRGPVVAVRHVLTPNITFRYRPDFGQPQWHYYRYYNIPGDKSPTQYSIFENGIFGYSPFGKSGALQLSLANNLEMKVKSKNDSLQGGTKKIVLIENFTIGSSYDIAKDSLNWSKLSCSGRTRLFNNLDLSYLVSLDPYIIDSTGKNINKTEWEVNHRVFRTSRNEWATSLNWQLNNSSFHKKKTLSTKTQPKPAENLSIPWNLTISYNFQYLKNFDITTSTSAKPIQTFSLVGDIKPTKGWKFGFMTGYDVTNKDFSYTSINIYRDLHCWEIVFNWIPAGPRKSYNFTLRVKAQMLHDVKLEKKTDFRDFY